MRLARWNLLARQVLVFVKLKASNDPHHCSVHVCLSVLHLQQHQLIC